MTRTIIIEDEINAREALKKMLKLVYPDVLVIAETGYVKDACTLIEELKPDLVFLDIELEDGSGFDILNQITNTNFKLIFTTAYNQYAIKAFKYSATDYLLKPIDPIELKEAIERAVLENNTQTEYLNAIDVLKNNLTQKEPKIVLKTTEQRFVLSLKDIIRLEADGAYTLFITQDKRIIISKNIKYYQELLDDRFIRCHQSHLVNSHHIKAFVKQGFIELSNKEQVPVSTRKKAEIHKIISEL